MNDREIAEAVAYCRVLWPHSPVPDVEQSMVIEGWRRLLGDLPAPAVTAAIDQLAAAGREFAPPPGVLRGATVELMHPELAAPSPEDAWGEVCAKIASVGMSYTYMPKPHLHWSHPAVERTVRAMGYRELCLSENQVADRAHFLRLYADGAERDRRALAAPPAAAALLADPRHRPPSGLPSPATEGVRDP